SIIPDEQEATSAALNMGQPGDLLLIFADAVVRSWKQITKFKPSWTPAAHVSAPQPSPLAAAAGKAARPVSPGEDLLHVPDSSSLAAGFEGLIRDERGVRLAPEAED